MKQNTSGMYVLARASEDKCSATHSPDTIQHLVGVKSQARQWETKQANEAVPGFAELTVYWERQILIQ